MNEESRGQHGDVDKLHGLAVLVDDAARELMVFLLYALHEDHVGQQVTLAVLTFALDYFHSDGVEADDLTDGVGYALLAHVSGDLEVLKVVVSKVDDIVSGGCAQIAQGIGHGSVAERVGDGLGIYS